MEKKKLYLSSEKDLRVFMLPLRQRLLHELAVSGKPMTGKQLADRLGITPSAAHHHIRQLESISLVEFDHCESINGIQARYVRLADVTVSLGLDMNDVLRDERMAIAKSLVVTFCDGFSQAYGAFTEKSSQQQSALTPLNDVVTAVLHLSDREANELHQMIMTYMNTHTHPGEDTKPWNFMLAAYCDDLIHQ